MGKVRSGFRGNPIKDHGASLIAVFGRSLIKFIGNRKSNQFGEIKRRLNGLYGKLGKTTVKDANSKKF